MAMYEEPIFVRNIQKFASRCFDDLDIHTVTFLGDPCPLPTAESGKMLFVKMLQRKLGW